MPGNAGKCSPTLRTSWEREALNWAWFETGSETEIRRLRCDGVSVPGHAGKQSVRPRACLFIKSEISVVLGGGDFRDELCSEC